MPRLKVYVTIGVTIALFCIFLSWLYFGSLSPTLWNAYKNSGYHIEFKYPGNWITSSIDEFPQKPIIFSLVLQDSKLGQKQKDSWDQENMFVGFQINNLDPSVKLGVDECLPKDLGINCFINYQDINGEKAAFITLKRTEGEGVGSVERMVEFIKNGQIYLFYSGSNGLPYSGSLLDASKKTFLIDQIASTFKFTD